LLLPIVLGVTGRLYVGEVLFHHLGKSLHKTSSKAETQWMYKDASPSPQF